MKVIAIVALVVGVGFLAVVTWGAAEAHYATCVNAVEARTPVATDSSNRGALTETASLEERRSGIDGCSHWPF